MSINSGEFAHFLCLECLFACWLLWELLLITGIPAQGLYFRWVLQFLFSRSLNLNWEDCIKWLNVHVYICIYYGLNACIPKTHIEILRPDVMVSGMGPLMWSGHEGWPLINGISTLIKEAPQSFPAPSTVRWLSEKMAVCNPRRALPKSQSWGHPDLGVPPSRTVREKFCCL